MCEKYVKAGPILHVLGHGYNTVEGAWQGAGTIRNWTIQLNPNISLVYYLESLGCFNMKMLISVI